MRVGVYQKHNACEAWAHKPTAHTQEGKAGRKRKKERKIDR